MYRTSISLKDIATKTGYSIKTVSRALNNHPDVNEKTKKLILDIAEKYSYYPNLLAKSLRTKTTFTIGYIVPDITNEFFGKVGIVIERELRVRGYSLLVSFTEESEENEINSLKLLLSKRVDGIVLATVGRTGEFLREVIHHFHVPVVVIDNKEEGIKTNLVMHDNMKGAYVLTQHLIEHGHERIACITGPLSETSGRDRLRGYQSALTDHGIPFNEDLIEASNWRIEGGYHATMNLLNRNTKEFSALFVCNSLMALGAYKALKKMNLKIPQDVACVSFDNFDFSEVVDPPMTTLESVEEEVGRKASQILLEKIKDKDTDSVSEYLVQPKLCIRKSCGCEKMIYKEE